MSRPRTSIARLFAIVVAALLLLGATACGGGSDDEAGASDAAAGPDTGEQASEGAGAGGEDEDPDNPLALGYQVSGESGTTFELELIAVADGVEQPPMDQTLTVEDGPRSLLLTQFIDSATITISVTEGESATLEVFYGRAVDPENPMAGVEIVDPIESVEVGTEPVTVELP